MSIDISAFLILLCPVISKTETEIYNNFSNKYRGSFVFLGNYFLRMIDQAIILGGSVQGEISKERIKGISYASFHLYNQDEDTKKEIVLLRDTIKKLCSNLNRKEHKILVDNLCDVIVALSEPEIFQEDEKYKIELSTIWRDIVEKDNVLKNNSKFSKYLNSKSHQ